MNNKEFEIKTRKKLIEVALPLDAINKASAREKSIRHGHPSTLHLWWARRPLATARAVIFSQLIDDPSEHPELFPTEEAQLEERQRLFNLIEQLVLWENTANEEVFQQVRNEIWKSWRYTCEDNKNHPRASELFDPEKLPAFHDPFAGGGALPLEAQRLGLESHASDLNPVAVIINKAMIEIPPKFAGRAPVNPSARKDNSLFKKEWNGAQGLAEDVLYYGQWIRNEAEKRIGTLFPPIEVTPAMTKERPDLEIYVGRKLKVIAYLWARTINSSNPAFRDVQVPLITSFIISNRKGSEAYVEPIISKNGYNFRVKIGVPDNHEFFIKGTKLSRGSNFKCLMSGVPMTQDYIRGEFTAKRAGSRLMAIVVESENGKIYLSPTKEQEDIIRKMQPISIDEVNMNQNSKDLVSGRGYGFQYWHELFTSRQLAVLTTLTDLIEEVRNKINNDAVKAAFSEDAVGLNMGADGATAYGESVSIYLAFAISKISNIGSTIATWMSDRGAFRETFARQAIPMTWDYAEANPFSDSGGSLSTAIEKGVMVIKSFPVNGKAEVVQADAKTQRITNGKIVSTDPPYYDNIAYSDLSDFFYVWLRRALKSIYPSLFATLMVPKSEELVALSYRHDSKSKAQQFFIYGMTLALQRITEQSHKGFPVTIYYAFKQSEQMEKGSVNTGWATFLEALISAGLVITGTWPVRTEGVGRLIAKDTNALASSIVLVCRSRASDAHISTRSQFVKELKSELPGLILKLQYGNIAPVDLAQAVIGPGMSIFTRYSRILDASGEPLTVRDALVLINQTLDLILSEEEGAYDQDTQWAITWFQQFGFTQGEYGIAEQLSKSKNTSVEGMVTAGILESSGGKVKLLTPKELPADWDPLSDIRTPVWEVLHHLVRVLEKDGEKAAGELMSKLDASNREAIKEVAYRLYNICERKNWSEIAFQYNALIQSWSGITQIAQQERQPDQTSLF